MEAAETASLLVTDFKDNVFVQRQKQIGSAHSLFHQSLDRESLGFMRFRIFYHRIGENTTLHSNVHTPAD